MKEVVGFIAALLVIGLMAYGGWYRSNSRVTIRLPADQAAISVAKRYEVNQTGSFAARQVDTSTNAADGTATYVVSRHGGDIARVTLKRFRKLGWQEAAYERVEQNLSEATK